MNPVFEAPRILGRLDPDIFSAVRRVMQQALRARYDIMLDGGVAQPEDMELSNSMRPLYEALVRAQGRAPAHTRLSIDIKDVPKHSKQRPGAGEWHMDGEPGVQTSDALPTEFLVDDSRVRLTTELKREREYRLTEFRRTGYLAISAPELATSALGWKIYTAPPREIVAFTTQFHRSPTNTTSKSIRRTWMRAS